MQGSLFDISGKSALVTGAAGLLGRQHSLALAEIGARVFVSDISMAKAVQATRWLQEQDPEGIFEPVELDVTSSASIDQVLVDIENAGAHVDVLVNNAALNPQPREMSNMSRLEQFDEEFFAREINIGLTGPILCSSAFGSRMALRGGGAIINIASDLSVIAPNQNLYKAMDLPKNLQAVKPVSYSVIKFALVGLTKYLATYWAEDGVRANAISPGGIENDQDIEFQTRISELIPLGRMGRANELRGAIQFLSSAASSYMTGQNLVLDGGRSVW